MARLGHGRKKVPGKGDKLPYHGRSAGYGAFVYPSKAPGSGSFPIGDLWHARYAVITVMSSTFDGSPAKRKKVLRAVAEEWPQYNWAAYWNKTAKKKSDLKSWDSLVGVASKKPRKAAANPALRVTWSDNDGVHAGHFSASTLRQAVSKAEKLMAEYYGVKKVKLLLAQEDGPLDATFEAYSTPKTPGLHGASISPGKPMGSIFAMTGHNPKNPRRNTMARRRRNSGNYLENPLGMPLSGNIQAVIVDEHYRRRRGSAEKSPKRVHIKKGKYALCGAGKGRVVAGPDKGMIKGVKPSDSKAISCYRCLKLHNINRGDDVERMIRAPGRRETHMMVPGGRQGMYISRKQLEHDDYPSRGAQVSGIEYFLGGTDEHPTQSRLLNDKQKRAREDDLRKRRSRRGAARKVTVGAGRGRRMVANPRSYKQGYDRGAGDFHQPEPLPASQLSSRSESYQFGYLEGYSDQAGGKSSRSSRRAASARRSYKPKARAKARRAKPRRRNSGLTDYQRHVQKERRSGKSMKQAAASWRRNGRRR